jgi:hypothetical protein
MAIATDHISFDIVSQPSYSSSNGHIFVLDSAWHRPLGMMVRRLYLRNPIGLGLMSHS